MLTITVEGTTGSGKSTVAHLVAETLRAAGINVEVQDDDPNGDRFVDRYRRIHAIAERAMGDRVVVRTRHAKT